MDKKEVIYWGLDSLGREENFKLVVPKMIEELAVKIIKDFENNMTSNCRGSIGPFLGLKVVDNKAYFEYSKEIQEKEHQKRELKRLKKVEEKYERLKESVKVLKGVINDSSE